MSPPQSPVLPTPQPVTVTAGLDRASFHSATLLGPEPMLLPGLVADWPAVRLARRDPASLLARLAREATGTPVEAIMLRPAEGGRVFYDPSLRGFNFLRNRLPLAQVIEQVLRYAGFPAAPAVAVQSAPIAECLPGFAEQHPMPLLDASIAPRIWLGTAITTPAHFDESSNIACVVAGRRRFTLFPPDQIANLYPGPLDYAPTGTPISLVDFRVPDLVRFPRFAQAMAKAQVAELGPGDALHIPPLWWHHVESLDRCNLLVNYWWHAWARPGQIVESGIGSLWHAVASFRQLPAAQRAAWLAVFRHYVFDIDNQAGAHLPAHALGMLGALAPEREAEIRRQLVEWLSH